MLGLVVVEGYLVVVVKVREVRVSSSVVVVLLVGVDGSVEVAMEEDRKMVVAVAALNTRETAVN